jgi:hypothetical protein
MKLKNGKIFNSKKALDKIKNTSLPIKTAYKIAKITKVIDEQYNFIVTQQNEIIKKYGTEENGCYGIKANDYENLNKYAKDFNEVLEIEEEIEIQKISLEELEKVELTINDVESIDFLIE